MLLKHYSDTIVVVWFPSSQIQAKVAEMPGSDGVVEGGVGGVGGGDAPIKRKLILVGLQHNCLQWSVPSADVGRGSFRKAGGFSCLSVSLHVSILHILLKKKQFHMKWSGDCCNWMVNIVYVKAMLTQAYRKAQNALCR